MIQHDRRPQDVVGDDPTLLEYWNTMPGQVQLQLLKSPISVSTLGELKMLREDLERQS